MTAQQKKSIETQLSNLDLKLGYVVKDVADIKKKLDDKYVTKAEFVPVRTIAFGIVTLVLTAVGVALIALVVVK